VNEKEVHLKKKEFQLLEFLMRNRDIVFSKEELYSRVWGLDSYGDYATVAVHINRLREEIEDNPSDSKHIITVWGVGYKFV
jgi:DNA-binding response OmpR family regulator